MHAVLRTYSGKGSKKLIDVIEKNKTEVEGPKVQNSKGGTSLFSHQKWPALAVSS